MQFTIEITEILFQQEINTTHNRFCKSNFLILMLLFKLEEVLVDMGLMKLKVLI